MPNTVSYPKNGMVFYKNTTPFLAFIPDTSGSIKMFKMTVIDS